MNSSRHPLVPAAEPVDRPRPQIPTRLRTIRLAWWPSVSPVLRDCSPHGGSGAASVSRVVVGDPETEPRTPILRCGFDLAPTLGEPGVGGLALDASART